MTSLERSLVHLYLIIHTLDNVNEQHDMTTGLNLITATLKKNERLNPGWKPDEAFARP